MGIGSALALFLAFLRSTSRRLGIRFSLNGCLEETAAPNWKSPTSLLPLLLGSEGPFDILETCGRDP